MQTHFNLALHGDAEQRDEVHDQNGPEDGDVEAVEEGADDGDNCALGHRQPELELRQSSDEGAELLSGPGGQGGTTFILGLKQQHRVTGYFITSECLSYFKEKSLFKKNSIEFRKVVSCVCHAF